MLLIFEATRLISAYLKKMVKDQAFCSLKWKDKMDDLFFFSLFFEIWLKIKILIIEF